MFKNLLLFTLLAVLISSCTDSLTDIEKSFTLSEIEGYWIDGEYTDSTITYTRASALADNQYCFGFQANGKFVEQKNAGWCGTPPISYAHYEGEWSVQDSVISISVPYWGGMSHYKWKITALNQNQLSYSILETDFEEQE